jgi:hypothetical protein
VPAPSCDLNNQIPRGSTITNVKLNVVHREGQWTGVSPSYFSTSCAPNQCINKVDLQVLAGAGSTEGSTGYKAADWNSFSTGKAGFVQPDLSTTGIPVCTTTSYCSSTWGDSTKQFGGSEADWSIQRNLTDALNTPEALANAGFVYTVTPANNGLIHYADLDGITLTVTYRPPTQPRPLRGCVTTRTQFYPPNIVGMPTAVAGTNIPGSVAQSKWFVGTDAVGGTSWGGGHDWLDTDWAADNLSTSGAPNKGDEGYGNFSATNGGNGGQQDQSDCPLLKSYSANGTSGVSVKLHVNGMIYAPSAAVELSGNDNDASFASDGIYVRHLTALRWKNGGQTPLVGGRPIARNPRVVILQICDKGSGCSAGHVRVRAKVEITDDVGTGISAGSKVRILSWIRNP